MSKNKFKITKNLIALIACGYLLIYLTLSYFGKYEISPTGEMRYSFGLSITDRLQWDPYGLVCRVSGTQSPDFNGLGFIYCPLIVIDRFIWHKDVNYFKT